MLLRGGLSAFKGQVAPDLAWRGVYGAERRRWLQDIPLCIIISYLEVPCKLFKLHLTVHTHMQFTLIQSSHE